MRRPVPDASRQADQPQVLVARRILSPKSRPRRPCFLVMNRAIRSVTNWSRSWNTFVEFPCRSSHATPPGTCSGEPRSTRPEQQQAPGGVRADLVLGPRTARWDGHRAQQYLPLRVNVSTRRWWNPRKSKPQPGSRKSTREVLAGDRGKAHPGQVLLQGSEGLLGLFPGRAQDHKIVRIADDHAQAPVLLLPDAIQAVEHHVSHQGADHAPNATANFRACHPPCRWCRGGCRRWMVPGRGCGGGW